MNAPAEFAPQTDLNAREGFLHYVAREGRIALRWTMLICIVAIVVCMVSPGFFFVAVIPAGVLLLAYVLLLLANLVERRSDRESHAALEQSETAGVADVVEDHTEDDQLAPDHAEIVKRETKVALAIIGGALLIGLGVAAIFLPARVLAIGAFVFFAYMLFIAMPVILGWFNDDVEMESRRLNDEPPPAQARPSDA
jgi:uncharacterized membrane protein